MSEPTKMNISVTSESHGRKSRVTRALTLDKVIEWIKSHEDFDDFTINGLIEIASKYPNTALPSFRKNFNIMLARVRQKRSAEQGEVNVPKKESHKSSEFVPADLDSAFKNFSNKGKDEVVEKSSVEEVSFDSPPAPSGLDDWANEERV